MFCHRNRGSILVVLVFCLTWLQGATVTEPALAQIAQLRDRAVSEASLADSPRQNNSGGLTAAVENAGAASPPAGNGKEAKRDTPGISQLENEDHSKKKKDKVRRADDPCLSWVKLGVPTRAVLLCVHGLGLNSGSWKKFGQDISQLGVATYAVDVQGFGSFVETKGHDKCNFKLCMANVEETLEWLHKANPNKPVFLMGESMGGAIALHVASEHPELMDGVISACSSGDRFKQKKTDVDVFLHMLMGPRRKFDIGDTIVDQAASGNDKLKEAWEGDKLDQMKLSPIELMQFQHFMNENHSEAEKITRTPVLMVQGVKDNLVKPEGTEELFDELKTKDKQIMMVQNAGHLIFEDQQFSDLSLAEVASWIFKHCPAVQLPPQAFDDAIEKARASLDAGQLPVALSSLQTALQILPGNANAHYLMGLVQTRLQHPLIARQHLVLASRLGQGNQVSRDANRALLSLPQNILAPRRVIIAGKKIPFAPSPQPSVLVFNATWCKPCQDMNKVMAEAKQRYGSKVKFQMVDVDDSANADLVEHYTIGPVPTTVFLTPNGDVAFSQVGYDGMEGMLKGLQKILPPLQFSLPANAPNSSGPK